MCEEFRRFETGIHWRLAVCSRKATMINDIRKDELERRLEQSKRLLKSTSDPTTADRIGVLIGDLERQQRLEEER